MTTPTMDSIDSPSFNGHSSNTVADTVDRVINELLLTQKNPFNNNDDEFSFNDDVNTRTYNNTISNKDENANVNDGIEDDNIGSNLQNVKEEHEIEFEFPIDEHISPRFPLFDRTLLLDHNHETDSQPAQAPAPVQARFSLGKLLIEARESGSCSSSDADELDGIMPETYCVWKPNESSRGKHKKSNSVSIGNSKRWNVRDLLKRSYSDDSYTTGNVSPTILFSPPVSPKPKVKGDFRSEVPNNKAKKIPAYKEKIGNIRLPAYYPYRQDQIGVFGNVNGSSKNLYRY